MSHKYDTLEPIGEERLFRRCKSGHIKNGEVGFWLFKNGNDEMMSVDAERCRAEDLERAKVGATGWGLVAFPANLSLELQQLLVFWPEEDNLAHTQVVGPKPQGIQKKFMEGATILLIPNIG